MLAYCFAIFKLWVTLQMWFCVFVTRWCCCRTLWNDICAFFFFLILCTFVGKLNQACACSYTQQLSEDVYASILLYNRIFKICRLDM